MTAAEERGGEPLELKRGYYLLHTDGGMVSSGRRAQGEEPGAAAIGVVLKTPKGALVEATSEKIGPATNDVAEYQALIEGLKLARDRGILRLRVYLDSELVVEQVNGGAGVNQEDLKLLHAETCDLVEGFNSVRVCWVPREWNDEADRLVDDALGR